MKKQNFKFIFLLSLIIIMLVPSTPFAASLSDVKNHWAEVYIYWAVDEGYIQGYPDSSFKPDRKITKAEFYRIANLLEAQNPLKITNFTQPHEFTDVTPDDWFYVDIQQGVSKGFIKANGTRLFPNEPISREEALWIYSYINGWTEDRDALNKFSDKNLIDPDLQGLVGAAIDHNILIGYPDGTFKPKAPLTRAEVVTLISKDKNPNSAPENDPLVGKWIGKTQYYGNSNATLFITKNNDGTFNATLTGTIDDKSSDYNGGKYSFQYSNIEYNKFNKILYVKHNKGKVIQSFKKINPHNIYELELHLKDNHILKNGDSNIFEKIN